MSNVVKADFGSKEYYRVYHTMQFSDGEGEWWCLQTKDYRLASSKVHRLKKQGIDAYIVKYQGSDFSIGVGTLPEAEC